MARIKIEWLTDYHECETCGVNYANGAKVFLDDQIFLDLTPHANCFSRLNWDQDEVFVTLLSKLGHAVEIT